MKTIIAFFAVLAVAVGNPLPLVQILVNVVGQDSIVNQEYPIIDRPVPQPNPEVVITPDPVILPQPVLPGGIVPEPVELPLPVLPAIIVPAPLPEPVLPGVIVPHPVVAPEDLN